jgi:K+-transporting ATPase ATPase A chain
LVVQAPKLDAAGKQVMTNGAAVMVDVPQVDAKGAPIMTNVPVMVDAKVRPNPFRSGAVAALESIKQLFTNGGGWYNVNSAHPFENPSPLSDFLEMLAIIVVPMAQVYMFGLLVGNKKHAWCLFYVMLAMYVFSFVWLGIAKRGPIPSWRRAAEHGRQGTAVWRDEQRAYGPLPAPRLTTARSIPCTTAICRWPA